MFGKSIDGRTGYSFKNFFFGLDYSDVDKESGLYTELVEELSNAGSDIRVVAPAFDELRKGLREEGGIRVLRVSTSPLFGVSLPQKGPHNLLLPVRYFFAA